MAILTPANIIEYLQQQGLCSSDIPWQIAEFHSRNRNFAIYHPDSQQGFFVKQLRVQVAESLRMMQREATVYWLVQNHPDFSPLSSLVPTFFKFDGKLRVIILEWLPEGRNSLASLPREFLLSPRFGRILGTVLADLHAIAKPSHNPAPDAFIHQIPHIFTAHRNDSLRQWLGAGQMQLISQMKDYPRLLDCLDNLVENWRVETLTHGDLKFENAIAHLQSSSPWVKLVDWELADFGDPCWDLGCIFQAYLYLCLSTSPTQPNLSLRKRLNQAQMQLESVSPSLQAFWQTYCQKRKNNREDALFLERSLQCMAARTIQMAIEVMHGREKPTPLAIALLETSAEVMDDPGQIKDWFGI
ncbi:MAG: phosphotransferase [Cyanobacteria bacterium SBLK]|nr:phosphotransferase [Cyanobacteria bacterium SBLK]